MSCGVSEGDEKWDVHPSYFQICGRVYISSAGYSCI